MFRTELSTKASVLSPKSDTIIQRDRLHRILDRSVDKPFFCVSAPAGFGKSTLVRNWLAQNQQPAVWLMLEPADNKPNQVVKRFLEAFEEKGLLTNGELRWEAATGDAEENENDYMDLLNSVAISLAHTRTPTVIIVDNLHHLNAPDALRTFANIISALPPGIKLFMLSRKNLPHELARALPLDQTLMLGPDELAFSFDEAQHYVSALLRRSEKSLTLTRAYDGNSVSTYRIWHESEGWPIFFCTMVFHCLHSKAVLPDASASTSIPFWKDYIEREVLEGVDDSIRELAGKLSQIGRFDESMLMHCLRWVYPVDAMHAIITDYGFAYRSPDAPNHYSIRGPLKHYFSDSRVRQQAEHDIPTFSRAYKWYIAQTRSSDAIALCIDNAFWLSATFLMEAKYRDLSSSSRWHEFAYWIERIPSHISAKRPLLLLLQARRFLFECAPLKALTFLNTATVVLRKTDVRLDHPDNVYEGANRANLINEATALAGAIERLYLGDNRRPNLPAHASGDAVLDEYQRGLKTFYLHQYQDAKSILMGVLQTSFEANHGVFFYTVGILSWIHFITGELDQWSVLASSWLDRIGESRSHNQAAAWFEGSFVFSSLERGQTQRASLQLDEASALRNTHPPRDIQFNLLVSSAMLAMEEQRWPQAERLLFEAERLSQNLPKVVTQSFLSAHALKAELILQTKGPEEALHSLDAYGYNENVATFAHNHECLIRARALLSLDNPKDALLLTAKVKEWSVEHGCLVLQIRSLVLEAIAQQKMRRDDKADTLFTEAVRIARAVGSVQPFLLSTPEMNLLLNKAYRAARYPQFLTKLMTLNGADVIKEPVQDVSLSCLSKREKEVFDLLVKGMSNPEIAQTLCRSLGTVKIHVHNIYRKTGANNRIAAINIYNRATEIGFA